MIKFKMADGAQVFKLQIAISQLRISLKFGTEFDHLTADTL